MQGAASEGPVFVVCRVLYYSAYGNIATQRMSSRVEEYTVLYPSHKIRSRFTHSWQLRTESLKKVAYYLCKQRRRYDFG